MAQQQKLDLQIRGLYTAPNLLSGVPQGALQIADNIVINAKNLAESRRGQTQYGFSLDAGLGQVNKLFNYASSLIVNYADKMAYDVGNGVWEDYIGTYNAPSSELKMRSLEALRNFYFTTDKGIYKIDLLAGAPVPAGAPRALGGEGAVTGSSGFLVEDSAVAYRLVWGYIDFNNNLILGAPSERLIVVNPAGSGSAKDVNVTFPIPDNVTTDYFYQLYRSQGTLSETDEPSDELQLVLQASPTSGEIAAASFTALDATPYSLMRATLYTSPSQEGIANANLQPPLALDMDVFKGCAFYANVSQKQTLSLALISVDSPSLGYVTEASAVTTSASAVVTGLTTADLRVGMRVIGTGIQSDSRIQSIDSGVQITMTKTATATSAPTVSLEFQDRFSIGGVDYWAGSAESIPTNTFYLDNNSTPGTNINETAINLIRLINTSTSNTSIYAYYTSGLEDLPGQILFEGRELGQVSFAATSTAGASFIPSLPTSGTAVSSNSETKQNRVYISKAGQVEAVPIYSYFDIGSANFPIQRVVALRDGIFFFKQDGIYRISGETFSSFSVTLIDNTVSLKVPESAVAFNNQVFCFTTQGVVAVSDSGAQLMSVPIEDTLLELSSEQYVNFSTASFGVAYESARLYMFFTVQSESDTFARQAFVYNSLTDSWSRWIMDRTCGVVNPAVNKLFMGEPDTGQVLIERKNYTNTDYADEEYEVEIASIDSDTEITLSDASRVTPGMTIVSGNRSAYIDEVTGNVLTVDSTAGFTVGDATVYTPILNRLQWAPIDAENPGILKQFSELTFMFKNAAFREFEATFATNISPGSVEIPVMNKGSGGWGLFPWGEQPWGGAFGGASVLRTYVPREKQRCSWLTLTIATDEAFTGFSLQGVSLMYTPMSSWVR